MIEKDFDDKIRVLVDLSVEEIVDSGVWSRIEGGLIRRKRMLILKRVGYVALAASLVIGTFLIVPSEGDGPIVVLAEAERPKEVVEEAIVQKVDNEIDVHKGSSTPKGKELYVKKESSAHKFSKTSVKQQYTQEFVQESTQESPPKSAQESTVKEVKEVKEVPKVTSKQKAPKKEYKTISAQIEDVEESSYLAMTEDVKRPKREVVFGLLSNMAAGGSLSEKGSSFPQFSSGRGSSANYGIVPISEIKNSLPVTIGLQLRVELGERFGVGIGANYTFLHSEYEAIIDRRDEGIVNQTLHYIGVPISLYYNILQTNSMKFYVNGGGMMEKGLQLNYQILDLDANTTHRKESVSGLQWSVNVGLGFEYKLINLLGIYIDPSLSYFFKADQPYSVRTNQPFQFKVEVGLRFHL